MSDKNPLDQGLVVGHRIEFVSAKTGVTKTVNYGSNHVIVIPRVGENVKIDGVMYGVFAVIHLYIDPDDMEYPIMGHWISVQMEPIV